MCAKYLGDTGLWVSHNHLRKFHLTRITSLLSAWLFFTCSRNTWGKMTFRGKPSLLMLLAHISAHRQRQPLSLLPQIFFCFDAHWCLTRRFAMQWFELSLCNTISTVGSSFTGTRSDTHISKRFFFKKKKTDMQKPPALLRCTISHCRWRAGCMNVFPANCSLCTERN